MPSDKWFEALGPNYGPTVRGNTGFYTHATKLAYGVNVQGSKCGVYGEAGNPAPPAVNSRDPSELDTAKAGVFGIGQDYGVFGRGFAIAGVYGENMSGGTGAYGLAVNANAIGAAGISKGSLDDETRAKESGIGIVGATETGEGFGVVGLSIGSLVPNEPAPVPRVIIKNGELIFERRLGSGTGILGASGSGTGILGASGSGNGGVFSSDERAQINLAPKLGKLPIAGQDGDLIVIKAKKGVRGIPPVPELWLCLRGGDKLAPAYWAQVQLGPTVQAQL